MRSMTPAKKMRLSVAPATPTAVLETHTTVLDTSAFSATSLGGFSRQSDDAVDGGEHDDRRHHDPAEAATAAAETGDHHAANGRARRGERRGAPLGVW